MIITAGFLEIADQLLLLGVDRDHWLLHRLELKNKPIDMFELRVAVRMLATLLR